MKELFTVAGKTITNQWLKYIIGLIILVLVVLISYLGYKEYRKMKDELTRQETNEKFYLNRIRSLKLTQVELMYAQDSLSLYIKKKLDQAKIKPSNTNSVAVSGLVINASHIDTIFIANNCSFNDTIHYNDKTILYASAKHDSISNELYFTSKLSISDRFAIINHWSKVYLNDYRNGWIRFWNFDWKRVKINEIEIWNDNDLIKFDKPTFIEIEK